MPRALRPLWTCPRCDAQFVVANTYHSCGRYQLDDLFRRADPHVFPLFRRFEAMVRAAGAVKMVPQKTRLVFMVRMRFINVQVRKSHLILGFVFGRRLEDPRFSKVESYSPRSHVAYVRVSNDEELDASVRRWIREARKTGLQQHLLR
jgi:hypothetical protein